MKHTDEQTKIIDCDLSANEILKVKAFAGTGKTTTLVEYTKARPETRFLYIAFNKSVQVEALKKFPKNVTCKTSHALAFPRFGFKYKNRLVPGFKANTVARALNIENFEDARFVIETLTNFLVSADMQIGRRHIPATVKARYKEEALDIFVTYAGFLADLMYSGENPDIGMLHDGYLKEYQLSRPTLPYDILLLDEAQDLNPVTADFLMRQRGPSKIIVGDSHQQIYSFRGAVDLMSSIESNMVLHLTRSFRFTPSIAAAANIILKIFKGENRKVVGMRNKQLSENTGRTIIARTNATLFGEAVRLVQRKRTINFVGGIAGYRLDRIECAFRLYSGDKNRIKDTFIRSFKKYDEMKHYAGVAEDSEIMSLCRVVEIYTWDIPRLLNEVKIAIHKDPKYWLTTAHKAKGLEWEHVHLADDFAELVKDDQFVKEADYNEDEFNLIYVALTRAINHVTWPKDSNLSRFFSLYRKMKNNHPEVVHG